MRNFVRAVAVLALAVFFPAPATPAYAATGAPVMSVAADGWHVNATLPGTTLFTFLVRVSGEADRYVSGQTSPFLVDPLTYGGRSVFVNARADSSASNPWGSPGVTFTVAPAKPVMSVAADNWHVNATLPGTTLFTFVIKVSGAADKYIGGQTSPFLVDPVNYGGRTVFVSARADSSTSAPWSAGVTFTAAPAVPAVSVAADHWHVIATLPGTDRFTFVVKVAGRPDVYFGDQTSPFALDRDRFGGRDVSVSARADSSASNPWAPGLHVIVPARQRYAVADVFAGHAGAGTDAKNLGLTMNRVDLDYGATTEQADAIVSASTSAGLVPLVILNQGGHDPIAGFDLPGWQTWAATVVARYGPGGSFWAGRTDSAYAPVYFEILNEPYGNWFHAQPDAAAYARFFAEVVTAAKAANPGARFLLAGLPITFKISEGPDVWSTGTWDALLKSAPDGVRAQSLADGVTVHPYGDYTSARGWQEAPGVHADFPQLPVWITEVGYRVCAETVAADPACTVNGVRTSEGDQAQWLQRDLDDFASWPWAAAFTWFKWEDYGRGDDPLNLWGLVRGPDGSHRPAYDVYQDFVAAHPAG